MRSKSAGWGEQTSSRQITPEVFDDERPFMAIPGHSVMASAHQQTIRRHGRRWSFSDPVPMTTMSPMMARIVDRFLRRTKNWKGASVMAKAISSEARRCEPNPGQGWRILWQSSETKGYLDAGAVDRSPSGRLLIRCIEERSADDSDSSKCSKVFSLG
ncbi:hypothetical protein CABS01_12560 [Colletotrichum abscissum]|uniref:uncharacterized protein n=1 Tax=Colletotrichum abscissum TaxID=1671311 RepID=UPI0027D75906|nr:uncharacterized protein CABS01_12560 [Colletotrichum abscissum]KAK1489979.1 hypothetical protein CABS01_12560 [Colletotrichum abscissum]